MIGSAAPNRLKVVRRGAGVLVVGLALVASFFAALNVLGSGSIVKAGPLDQLKVNAPVHNDHGFFIVLLSSGEVVAFTDQVPGGYSGSGGRDCRIKWIAQGSRGTFADGCGNSTFAITGWVASGSSPRPMDRYSVEIKDGNIFVDTSRVLSWPEYGRTPIPDD